MAVLNTGLAKVSGGYTIDQSLRFNDNDTAYLSKTFSSGDEQKWTFSAWIKRGSDLGTYSQIFGTPRDGGEHVSIFFNTADRFCMEFAGGTEGYRHTSAKYRDTSAWYHFMVATDTTLGDRASRCKLYVNGELITDFQLDTKPDQNLDTRFNRAIEHNLGRNPFTTGVFDGYMAEVHWIDGTQLTPSSFGETDEDYGHWKPKKVSGLTYGTNGFYLDFSDSAALGDDAAGSNDFTVNNLTASDQMLDTPTNNFATLNPLSYCSANLTLTEGNLKTDWHSNGEGGSASTFELFDGGYVEVYIVGSVSGEYPQIGVTNLGNTGQSNTRFNHGVYVNANGSSPATPGTAPGVTVNGSPSTTSYTTGDIVQIAYKNNKVYIGKNNTWMNSANLSSETGNIMSVSTGTEIDVAFRIYQTYEVIVNFGQDSSFAGNKTSQGNQDSNDIGDFYYTPPTGFLALCTSNLPDPTVTPSEHFNTMIWSGDGNNPRTISGVGFQPDLNWIKLRSGTDSHHIFDAVRGAGERIMSDSTSGEESSSAHTAFTSDGFTISDNGAVNGSGSTYVAWNWKAGGSGSSNTDGSITSTVSANQDAGFSIVSYTGNGSDGATIGHGLSKAPEMVIFKDRDASVNWAVMGYPTHPAYSTDGNMLFLNLTEAQGNSESNEISLGASTITLVDSGPLLGTSGNDYIAYCFHSVEGFSRCGKYEGNGSTDGVYVHLGFRPMWIMIKRTSTTSDWAILDSARGFNSEWEQLSANESDAEGGFDDRIDFVSNGFKTRASSFPNGSSVEFIYLAFAEQPFKHTNAK